MAASEVWPGYFLVYQMRISVSQYKGLTLDYSGWAGDGPAGGVLVSHGNGATSVSGLLGGGAGWGLSVGGGYSHVGLLDASNGVPFRLLRSRHRVGFQAQSSRKRRGRDEGAGRGTALGNHLGNPSYQSCLNQLNDRCPKLHLVPNPLPAMSNSDFPFFRQGYCDTGFKIKAHSPERSLVEACR